MRVQISDPTHPNAGRNGKVYRYVAVVVAALGKPLRDGVQIHHVNGDESDDSPGNLVACDSEPYHRLLHVRTRALLACGDSAKRQCLHCRAWEHPSLLIIDTQGHVFHRECRNAARVAFRRKAG